MDLIDDLARALCAARLELVVGFSEGTAQRISKRECPESYYEMAEALHAEFPAVHESGEA